MKDIFEDPRQWLVNAAGTPPRAFLTLGGHVLLVVLGYALDSLAMFVVAGIALPALHLYATYRVIGESSRGPGE